MGVDGNIRSLDPKLRHDRALKAKGIADGLVSLNGDLDRIEANTLTIAKALGLDVLAAATAEATGVTNA